MLLKFKINLDFKIEKLEDLSKLKTFVEANKLNKPNFSEIARSLKKDRRTVKNYYDGFVKKDHRNKPSKLDKFSDLIDSLLFGEDTLQKFYYKDHLYRYLVREHNLKTSRSNFNHYILSNEKFKNYFKNSKASQSIKSETPFGRQAQFDWKEKIKFNYSDGTFETINIGSLVLSASRFKVWIAYPSTSQEFLFDFLAKSFKALGGVPMELIIDNASTMMDKARTETSKGKINNKFYQFSKDFGFKIKPCVRARPQTKAKVENPMRILDEIYNYNGKLKDFSELNSKLSKINEETNLRINQAINLPPILVFEKEKEFLLPLPSDKVISQYELSIKKLKVDSNSLIQVSNTKYSVPPSLIGKIVSVQEIEDKIYIYSKQELIAVHKKTSKLTSYSEEDHLEMISKTFPQIDNVEKFAKQHLEDMELFNEQLSEIV